MDDFAGTIVHPQAWPEGLDFAGKKIVVIGSGATAVTLVPALARSASHVTMLQRSPTYIASLPEKSPVVAMLRKVLPAKQAGTAAKWFHAFLTQAFYQVSRKYPKLVRRMLSKGLERQLPAGYDIATHFTPRYDPWDQRFCAVPNGDLFKSISAGAASVVTDGIDRFTESGLLLASGNAIEADIIVTATGLELLFLGGIALSVDGEPVDPSTRLTYKGMMIEGVPNMALAIGYTNASWTLKCDLTCDYVCRLLNHMRERGLTECVARNRDASATSGPILGLTSGYIQRSAHLLPKQGTTHPWKVHQSYLRDYRALKMSDIDDSIMEFSGSRMPEKTLEPVGVLRRSQERDEGVQRPGGRHHRGGLGHRPGPGQRAGATRGAPGAQRHRRHGSRRDRGAVRGLRGQDHVPAPGCRRPGRRLRLGRSRRRRSRHAST